MPETAPPPEAIANHQPSLARRVAGYGLAALGGFAGSYLALGISDPSASEVIGISRIEIQTDVGSEVQALNTPLTHTKSGIAIEVKSNVTINDKDTAKIEKRLPRVIERVSQSKGGEETYEIFADAYETEFKALAQNILLRTAGTLALGGMLGLGVGLWTARRHNLWAPPNRRFGRSMLASGLVISSLGISGSEMGMTYATVDREDMTENLELQVKQLIGDHLSTSTRSAVYDLNEVGDEIQRKIHQALRYFNTKSSNKSGDKLFIVGSDEHSNPLVPPAYTTLGRATTADGILSLGDTVDTNLPAEQDLLDGLNHGGIRLKGYQDIKGCLRYDANFNCTKEGAKIPFGILSGNHRPADPARMRKELGMTDLNKATEFQGIPIAALDDACADLSINCTDGRSKKQNARFAESYLKELQASAEPLPKTIFLASYDAVDTFVGIIPVIFAAGKHQFKVVERDGSIIIYTGSLGQGGVRGGDEASALILDISEEGYMVNCRRVTWQALDSSVNPIPSDCLA